MTPVLVINSGSSSFKYQLIDIETERALASGLVERIGEKTGSAKHTVLFSADGPSVTAADATRTRELPIPDHTAGFAVMLEAFEAHGPSLTEHPPVAVGHRVVQGGARFFEPTLITRLVEINIEDLSILAPLHNPGALAGIRAARRAFRRVPHVAVFDTAFHQTMPAAAYTYAIDRETAERHRLRKYGFHGTSHKYVSEAAAAFLGRPAAELKQIVLHLGNGASASAIDGGRSVDTSMGLTPLEGLVMGTRSGDIDPSVLLILARFEDMGPGEIDTFLNKKSGLLGLAGVADMRDIQQRRAAGDEDATLAFDVYVHRLRAYIGAYLGQLGGADVISFTAGVGENAAAVRAAALETFGYAGVRLDPARNEAAGGGIRVISTDDSPVTVLVVPTDEEVEIARQSYEVARTIKGYRGVTGPDYAERVPIDDLPDLTAYDGVLFDLDGVLTPTADVHMHAWQAMFTELFAQWRITPPYTEEDYFLYVDGKKRYDGVASLLRSRDVEVPWGEPTDPVTADTVCGIGNRKNVVFERILRAEGIAPYPGSLALVERLQAAGVPIGVVSSSKNAREVLTVAGLIDRFPVIMDGLVAEREDLPSKPAPDMFARAAELLGVDPARSAAVEDAHSGVQSAAAAGYALVVGVDRGAGADALRALGAHVVVDDLGAFVPSPA